MASDLRFALRSLLGSKALTTAIVVTIGLALAASAALFSIFDGLLFRPLPFPDADRLVHVDVPREVRRRLPRDESRRLDATLLETRLLEDRISAEPAVLIETGAANAVAWGLRPVTVSASTFRVLGVTAAAGRIFADDEDAGARVTAARDATGEVTLMEAVEGGGWPSVVMLSHELWQSRYGGNRELIGAPIDVPGIFFNRRPRLVGVLPPGFAFPDGANIWIPSSRPLRRFTYAKLAPGATVAQAESALPGVVMTPLRDHLQPDGAWALAVLLAGTGLMLVVAWVQVAGLQFARAAGRASEIGVRLALGAGRLRLARQFAAEAFLVAGAGLAVALVAVTPLTSAIVDLLPAEITRGQWLAPDLRTVAFAAVLSFCGVLVLTVTPIAIIRRCAPLTLMRGSPVGATRRGATRTRTALLVAQLALTATLIYMSGLAWNSFSRISAVDLGFRPEGVIGLQLPPLTMERPMPGASVDRHQQRISAITEIVRQMPGVRAVASGCMPFDPQTLCGASTSVAVDGGDLPVTAAVNYVSSEFVDVLGIRLVEGRISVAEAMTGGGYHALINEAFAREIGGLAAAVGRTVTASRRTARITGVVADFVTTRPDLPVGPQVLLVSMRPLSRVIAKIESGERGEHAAAAIRAGVARIWPDSQPRDIIRLSDVAATALTDFRARAVLLLLISALCVPLAVAGIAGAVAYGTRLRRREIAIRLALGAAPSDIRARVSLDALRTVSLGVGAGLAGGFLMGRAMSAYLYGVEAADPTAMAAVVIVLLAAGWFAAFIPARRAMRIEPAEALRE